jgi:hypothetical protein
MKLYKLGDLVFLDLPEDEKNNILTNFPNSVGSKYILEKIIVAIILI